MSAPGTVYTHEPFELCRIDAWALRAPIERPVETSFGVMRDRPAVFVRVEDKSGAHGFGEIWCNFPGCGAEHRVRLATEDLGPLLIGRKFHSPQEAHRTLTEKVRIRIIQSGEAGPYRQAIAGLDTAIWDLAARMADKPLRQLLDASAATKVPAYASGIHITSAPEMIAAARSRGFHAFKVKVGFDAERDVAILRELFPDLQAGERLFADANQAWDLEAALSFTRAVTGLKLDWLEEPLPADALEAEWARLAKEGGLPLAAGENLAGEEAFSAAIASGCFSYVQPDLAKWGGLSGCLPVARAVLDAGLTYCPHYLGGGIGLAASAHLLAAAGGPGLLEVDANPNPLREAFAAGPLAGGSWSLGQAAGLGIEQIPQGLLEFETLHGIWPD